MIAAAPSRRRQAPTCRQSIAGAHSVQRERSECACPYVNPVMALAPSRHTLGEQGFGCNQTPYDASYPVSGPGLRSVFSFAAELRAKCPAVVRLDTIGRLRTSTRGTRMRRLPWLSDRCLAAALGPCLITGVRRRPGSSDQGNAPSPWRIAFVARPPRPPWELRTVMRSGRSTPSPD
jgi:hypothetical protein